MKKFLVTGVAGFIGSKLAEELLKSNYFVIGIDNLNDYYNPHLKRERLKNIINTIVQPEKWIFLEKDINDLNFVKKIFKEYKPDVVINLAAQAGVRYSLNNPLSYVDSNLVGFVNILEMCRQFNIEHLVYASSSSVYGANRGLPFSENQPINHPISLYGATKIK